MDFYNDNQYRSVLDIEIYDSNWGTLSERTVMLSPYVWNHVRIPMDNSFRGILAMELYVESYHRTDREIYVDNIRLVKEKFDGSSKK